MLHEVVTALEGTEVLRRANLTLRGQGGEEIAMAVMAAPGGTRVRASTLLFDQTVDRFFSTLPASSEPVA
jgi:hypothetical protein